MKTLLSLAGAMLLATSLYAQPQPPATQPVRPPDRPPTGEPTPPVLPRPEPERERDLGGEDERPLPGRTSPEDGNPASGTTTLRGCLERVDAKGFRLRAVKEDDATVTENVRLAGDVALLRKHVGRVVELRGTYEQATPATTPAQFNVTRVRPVTGSCGTK